MLQRFSVVPVLVTLALLVALCNAGCGYEVIFNFGDSNSDTGGFWWAFPEAPPPNGMTYFKRPVGRASDGRLIIDFLAERIGIPFVSPYLKSIGSDFRHGANFATLASTVLLPQTSLFVSGLSPFALPIQLNQMKHFKIQVDKLYTNGSSNLPPPDVFGKSLYTFYIGQNDFTSDLAKSGVEGVKERLPRVISQITGTIKELHELGGRTFFVQNLAPIGCYPAFLVELPHGTTCDRTILQTYIAGLKYSTVACCGNGGGSHNFNPKVFCGNTKFIDGQNLTASACDDPENYVSWDGIHITEAASKIVVDSILGSGFTDPPFEINCS
nr:GDSL esterase/lipase At4g01130-like [Tanacetum cinerariifolium]